MKNISTFSPTRKSIAP